MDNELLTAADTARQNAAEQLTSLLRSDLINKGWPEKAAYAVVLRFDDNSELQAAYEGPNADEAYFYEYGNERVRPTSVVRQFLNRKEVLEKVYMHHLEEQLGELV